MASENDVLEARTRTWYGLPVDISVSSDNWHRVKVSKFPLPHPGLVNFLTRWEMPVKERLRLTYRHELGHLQMLPVPLLHLLFILWPRPGKRPGPGWSQWLIGFLTHQAVWEIAAETYVAASAPRAYSVPRTLFGRWLYASFWGGMIVLSIVGTGFMRKRTPSLSKHP